MQGGLLKSIRSNFALQSKNIGELSCICLKEGKLVELAVLLMVAHEWLIGKSNQYFRVSLSENGTELHRCFMLEMSSAIFEETLSIAKFESSKLVRKCKARREILYSAKLLLKVFEKAGYCIDQYLQSNIYQRRTRNVQVAEDVEFLLKFHGFHCSQQDSNLSDMKCFQDILEQRPEQAEKLGNLSKRFPLKDIGTPSCYPVHLFPLVEKKHVGPMLSGQRTFHVFGSAARSFHTCQILDSSFGFKSSKPKGTETLKTVKPLTADFLFGEQLTMFARAFRRGIKRS